MLVDFIARRNGTQKKEGEMPRRPIASAVILLTLGCALSLAAATREPLSFEDRVKAQEAIERVYYNHRIWPKENPQPKPPFEEMVPRSIIEAKVTDYLKKCVALDQYWKRPITGEQLQAEIDRMEKGTKDPETLHQLLTALNKDPYLFAECLARPLLADRLIHNWYAYDTRFHGKAKAQAEKARYEITPENFDDYPLGECRRRTYRMKGEEAASTEGSSTRDSDDIALTPDEFQRMLKDLPQVGAIGFRETAEGFTLSLPLVVTSQEIALSSRFFAKVPQEKWWWETALHIAVVNLRAEGSITFSFHTPQSGGTCDDQWLGESITSPGVPYGRDRHTAVWTGTEMIIWGGGSPFNLHGPQNSGGRYNPSTDTWTATSWGVNCPEARFWHTAVWTGTEMIVWGGTDAIADFRTGGRYNPSTDTWTATSMGDNCPSGRDSHTAVWTGTEMVVWGGWTPDILQTNTGGRYNPTTDTWTTTATGAKCPLARYKHSAIWTHSEMIVWGGAGGEDLLPLNSGGRYAPSSDTWTPISTGDNCPSARQYHTTIWTGTEMIVWGGEYHDRWGNIQFFNTGARYNPSSDMWATTPTGASCPSPRQGHTAVWTGMEMVVWGGYGEQDRINTGGRYDPVSDTWVATSVDANCPSGRGGHAAVWTGTEMVLWGGGYQGIFLNSGGKYDPSTDTWVATSVESSCPSARFSHTAIWTGSEMVVWGGTDFSTYFKTGGRYNPSTDSWMTTATGANCPAGRSAHAALWTGTDMIVWGGWADDLYFQTGGRYNAISDSWENVTLDTNSPSPRKSHTAVWTGSEMIIWGGDAGHSGFNSGARYNPLANSWAATSTGGNCPSGRTGHTAIWTGTEMIIWGGSPDSSGGRYDPSADSWVPTSTGLGCPKPRSYHSAVWSGTEMIVWGGNFYVYGQVGTGGRYNPFTDSWAATSTGSGCPVLRFGHTAVWTGTEMLIWGGLYSFGTRQFYNSGGRYDPKRDAWISTDQKSLCPTSRGWHTAVWADSQMIVWGGGNLAIMADGGIYHILPSSLDLSAEALPPYGAVPLSASFIAAAIPSGCSGAAGYFWRFGDGATSTEQNPLHTYASMGDFSWTVQASLNGVSATKSGLITVTAAFPGDCDGDSQVSIGEVQKAINMFLGLLPVGCGVECNGDGAVSIGEIQKVINAFLGLTTEC